MAITMEIQLIFSMFIVLGHPNFPRLIISSTCNGKTVRPYNAHTEVNFELTSAHQSDNQTDEKVVMRMVDEDPKIEVNFRNLFDSITKSDMRKTGIYRNILEQETVKEQQAFDTVKEELQHASERKNFYNTNGGIGEKVTVFKRQAQEDSFLDIADEAYDSSKEYISNNTATADPLTRFPPAKDGYNVSCAENNSIPTSTSSPVALGIGPHKKIAVVEVTKYLSPITNADEVIEHVFMLSLNTSANTSGVIEAPTTRFAYRRRRTTNVPFFLSEARASPTNTSADIAPASTLLPEKIHRNLQPIIESKNFRISTDKRQYLRTHCGNISWGNINEIAQKTAKQFKDPTYVVLRKYRLTASNFGKILNAIRHRSYPPALYKELLGDSKANEVPESGRLDWKRAVRWGKFHEATVLEILKKLYPSWNIKPAGLYLHESGLLGASPDGVTDEAVIEIKCPYRFRRDKTLEESLLPGSKYIITRALDGTYYVNPSHAYYDQVQAEILFSGKQYGLLFVWTPNEAKLFRIEKDESWAKNIDLILDFYMKKFVPYVLDLQKNDKTEVNKIKLLMV